MRIAETADQRQQDHEDLLRLAVSRETKGEVTAGLASSDVADGTHENTDMKEISVCVFAMKREPDLTSIYVQTRSATGRQRTRSDGGPVVELDRQDRP